jgi:hypothetical protein
MAIDAKTCRENALQCAVMALAVEAATHGRAFTLLYKTWTNLAIELERTESPCACNHAHFPARRRHQIATGPAQQCARIVEFATHCHRNFPTTVQHEYPGGSPNTAPPGSRC